MIRRAILTLALVFLAAQSPLPGFPPGLFGSREALSGGFTTSCTQSSDFIARTSGQDVAHKTAYDTLICGLVNQNSTISGTLFSRLDALYMLRGADSTVILLNLIQNNFNLTAHGGITFSTDSGVTSNGTTGYYDTGLNPTTVGGQYSKDSASIAFCSTAAIGVSTVPIGAFDGTAFAEFANSGIISVFLNNAAPAPEIGAPAATLYQGSRTASNLVTLYNAGSSTATDATATSQNLNANIFVLARNNGGPDGITNVNITMAAIGAGYSATDAANFRTLIAAYMAALGGAAC